ncbi:MAG: oligosaccharide flippase family protein, partial [Ignavibacteriota bacterium]
SKRVFFASLIARGTLLGCGIIFLFEGYLTLQSAVGLFVSSAAINAVFLVFAFRGEVGRISAHNSQIKFSIGGVLTEIKKIIISPRHIKLFLATPLMLYGITTWGSDILSGVLGRQPDILMMRGILGEHSSEIGFYLSATLLLLITEYIFLFGLGGTLVSIFSKLAHDDENNSPDKSYPSLSKARLEIAGFQNVVLLPLCAYMMMFSPEVIRSIYGPQYNSAIPMLRIGLIGLAITISIFAGGMQITTLVAIGKERVVFRNRLCWGIINLIGNYFLIRAYGGLGAVIGTQFANAASCGSEYFISRKYVSGSFRLVPTLKIVAIAALSAIGTSWLLVVLNPGMADIFRAIIGALITAAIISALYLILRIPEAKKVWRRIQGLFNRFPLKGLTNE